MSTALKRLLLTRKQAGEEYGGVSVATIIRLEKAGKLHPIRLTPRGQVFIRAEELAALIENAE